MAIVCSECQRETTVTFSVADYGYETKDEVVEVVGAEGLCWVCWQNLPHPPSAKLTSGSWPPVMAPEEEAARMVSRER